MSNNIDEQIDEAEKKIEKLKILKTKQDELKQLEAELGVTGDISTAKPKEKREKHPRAISPRTRKVITSVVVVCLISMVAFIFVTRVEAADPTVVYANPGDGGLFADTDDGDGVSWTVNVSDGDGDIQWVKLYSNDSGIWALFYDSGALGGVAYHNTSGQNGNWTGSWTTYYWNISANDGSTHDTTYSFTTEYVFGDTNQIYVDDTNDYKWASMYKNATGEYYMALHDDTDHAVRALYSSNGIDWALNSSVDVDTSVQSDLGLGVWSWHTYATKPGFFYVDTDDYWHIASFDGSSWSTSSIDIFNMGPYFKCGIGASMVYYDGTYQLLIGHRSASYCTMTYYAYELSLFAGTPATFTKQYDLYSYCVTNVVRWSNFQPSLNILNGKLVMTCINDSGAGTGVNGPMRWYIYDGVQVVDKGDVFVDTITGLGVGRDRNNNQLVAVYSKNADGNLYYRVLSDIDAGWSSEVLLMNNGYTFVNPQVSFVDSRVVVTVANNKRGLYDVYNIYAPDYSGRVSGFNLTYNRIQWPDASPGDTDVNSTVFSLKNLNNRDIKTITWHFEDIGEIANASNIEMWTNMSGAWTSIGTTDASGDISTLDISGLMAGGGEWIPGQTIYWKAEILAIGAVNEDVHSCDESIFYKITF